MRVRIRMSGGDVVDAEEFSTDNGATWAPIEVAHVVAAMGAETGYTVVRDAFTSDWRAFRNARIESIGPAPDLDAAVDAETERRIARLLAGRLPGRIEAVTRPPVGRPGGADPPGAETRPDAETPSGLPSAAANPRGGKR